MSKIYFDTSALLPYYREEPISRKVQTLLSTQNPPVLISDLTRVEMASAIARWVRMSEIDEAQASLIEETFHEDIKAGLFLSQPLTAGNYQQALKWLCARKTALRSLDALHIACCQHLGAKLITCDGIMHQAAGILGVESVWLSAT